MTSNPFRTVQQDVDWWIDFVDRNSDHATIRAWGGKLGGPQAVHIVSMSLFRTHVESPEIPSVFLVQKPDPDEFIGQLGASAGATDFVSGVGNYMEMGMAMHILLDPNPRASALNTWATGPRLPNVEESLQCHRLRGIGKFAYTAPVFSDHYRFDFDSVPFGTHMAIRAMQLHVPSAFVKLDNAPVAAGVSWFANGLASSAAAKLAPQADKLGLHVQDIAFDWPPVRIARGVFQLPTFAQRQTGRGFPLAGHGKGLYEMYPLKYGETVVTEPALYSPTRSRKELLAALELADARPPAIYTRVAQLLAELALPFERAGIKGVNRSPLVITSDPAEEVDDDTLKEATISHLWYSVRDAVEIARDESEPSLERHASRFGTRLKELAGLEMMDLERSARVQAGSVSLALSRVRELRAADLDECVEVVPVLERNQA